MKNNGYKIILFYFYVSDVYIALTRIEKRVLSGGHNIPEETVKRRYLKSLHNFNKFYKSVADEWYLYDNDTGTANLNAKCGNNSLSVINKELYHVISEF